MVWWKKVGAAITKPAPIIATAVTNPAGFIENPRGAVREFTSQPIGTQVAKGAVSGAALGAVAGGAAGLTSFGKFLGTKLGKVAAVGGGAAILAPQATETIISNPDTRDIALGGAIGGLPLAVLVGLEKGTTIISEVVKDVIPDKLPPAKDVITGAGILGGATAATAGGLYIYNKIKGDDDDNNKNQNNGSGTPTTLDTSETGTPTQAITPETKTYRATPSSGKRSRRRKRKTEKVYRVSQSVKVNINNRNSQNRTFKKYNTYIR